MNNSIVIKISRRLCDYVENCEKLIFADMKDGRIFIIYYNHVNY